MDFPAPLSISSSRPASNLDLGLRPFQRVTAQVLTVNGTTAVLEIEGHPVVAQLTSADQGATLLSQRNAQFIITKLTGQEITLKLLRLDEPGTTTASQVARGPELAVRLLEQNHIPVNTNNLMLARFVLSQGLPLTPGLLNELLGALSEFGAWNATHANLAAALKAAGLPVTAQSLALASRPATRTGEALGRLIAQLQSVGQNLPPELLKQIRQNLQMLEEQVISVGGDTARLAAQLKTAVGVLGRSLESVLLEQSQKSENTSAEHSLFSLFKLRQALGQAGETELAESVEKFLGDLRQHQFLNVKPEAAPGQETWSEIGFRLRGERGASARLRIHHEARSNSGEIGPACTRLVLQVDVSESETVEVDLALNGKGICTQVTAPDPAWCQQAESELPSLEQALHDLGYSVKETKIEVGDPRPFERLKPASGSVPLMTVNIEA